jgi:hypothetical protein
MKSGKTLVFRDIVFKQFAEGGAFGLWNGRGDCGGKIFGERGARGKE